MLLTLKDNFSVFNFSKVYDHESFYRDGKGSFKCVNMTEITGTNCMCDDSAIEQIKELIKAQNIAPEEVHFIDSGNYHYMSSILTDMVKEPFSLVVIDHHPDMQRPMFGEILSCGGWVLEVMRNNPNLKEVYVIGADSELIDKLDEEDKAGTRFYSRDDIFAGDSANPENSADPDDSAALSLPDTGYPIYLSLDKDVICKEELDTNWDQGDMTISQVLTLVKELLKNRKVIGFDICGEISFDQEDCDIEKALEVNDDFNRKIVQIVTDLCQTGLNVVE